MQCAVCRGPRLTPPGVLLTGHGTVAVSWKLSAEKGWFGSKHTLCSARSARVCGDCGHVMLFTTPEDLAAMREKWPQLTTPDP
jgi:hypothetical protein